MGKEEIITADEELKKILSQEIEQTKEKNKRSNWNGKRRKKIRLKKN